MWFGGGVSGGDGGNLALSEAAEGGAGVLEGHGVRAVASCEGVASGDGGFHEGFSVFAS